MSWRLSQLLIFVGLLVCGIVAIEATRSVREVHGTVDRDLQSVWYLAAAITLPPGYAMLAPIPMAAYRLWRVQQRPCCTGECSATRRSAWPTAPCR